MAKKLWLAMKIKEPDCWIDLSGRKCTEGPEGTVGFCPVFKTKKAARRIYGKNVQLIRIEKVNND